jgi:hypothetical protein
MTQAVSGLSDIARIGRGLAASITRRAHTPVARSSWVRNRAEYEAQ